MEAITNELEWVINERVSSVEKNILKMINEKLNSDKNENMTSYASITRLKTQNKNASTGTIKVNINQKDEEKRGV